MFEICQWSENSNINNEKQANIKNNEHYENENIDEAEQLCEKLSVLSSTSAWVDVQVWEN